MTNLKRVPILRIFQPGCPATAPKSRRKAWLHGLGMANLVLFGLLLIAAPSRSMAAAAGPEAVSTAPTAAGAAQPAGAAAEKPGNHLEQTEQQDEKAVFRHSPVVRAVGRLFHLQADSAARFFEYFNFGLLMAGLLFLFFKFFPRYLRHHREEIRKHLVDARAARDRAEAQLQEIEHKLSGLEEELRLLRERAERELADEETRMRESMEQERQRVLAAVDREITAMAAAARRQIRRYAGELAIDRARRMIALSDREDQALTAGIAFQMAQDAAAQNPEPGRNGRNGGHA